DASVPFAFDVHAMIFSDDAPALEAALHKAFDDKKVNMINTRREFFHVTLEEIEEVVKKNFDKTVEFTKIPNAEQFRESQMMRRQLGLDELTRQDVTVDDIQIPAAAPTPATAPSPVPSPAAPSVPSIKDITLDPSKEYLWTKWGVYEMPEPYHIYLAKGSRDDLKLIATV
ncbi:MAG: GIY-YIG nuclease family protein, partial [Lachnospiraceae bacterium]|nr:GIY-YIG nuclease family protein [Lachnospiraceae bacterium]